VLVLKIAGAFILAVAVLAGLIIGAALVVAEKDREGAQVGQTVLVISLACALLALFLAFS
jgi:cation transport ATPase